RIIRQALRRAVSKQVLDHLELPEFGGPGERGRTEVLVAGRQIGASFQQILRLPHIALPCCLVERRDAQPIVRLLWPLFTRVSLGWCGAVAEEQLFHALVGTPFPRY